MRIAFVSETWPPDVNGVALTVHGLAESLRRRGHCIDTIRLASPAAVDENDLALRGLPLPRYPGLRFGLPADRRLLRRWSRCRPDVVYIATEGPLGASALRAARRLGIASISGFHTRFDQYTAHYGVAWLRGPARAWLRRFHRRCDLTLVPTRELADELAGLGVDEVAVLRRAVDTRLFHPGRRDRELRARWGCRDRDLAVIHVGRIAAEKNLPLLLRSFRTLQARVPDARLVLVGDGPQRAALAAANPDVIFAGVQRGEALAAHYASADLFLFPSLSETFGNVVLEAMASGLATVAFDTGAAREHIVDGVNGACVPAPSAAAFIEAAFALAADPALREGIGQVARESVAALDLESVAGEFETLLAQVLERRPGGWLHAVSLAAVDA
jgi:glycosyltransferase involved in cell wall biosynthesis